MDSDPTGVLPESCSGAPPALSCQVRDSATDVCVALSGELDLATAAELRRELQELAAPGRRVAIDLSGLTFMDAHAVGTCVAVQREAQAVGCHVGFAGAGGIVARVLRLCEVEDVLRGWLRQP